jgi:hypothetical protein
LACWLTPFLLASIRLFGLKPLVAEQVAAITSDDRLIRSDDQPE